MYMYSKLDKNKNQIVITDDNVMNFERLDKSNRISLTQYNINRIPLTQIFNRMNWAGNIYVYVARGS